MWLPLITSLKSGCWTYRNTLASTQFWRGVFSAGGVFSILGHAALLAPFMALDANRIVASEGWAVWRLAGPEVKMPGLSALVVGLSFGLFALR
jgi:osmoprotectant transport system permease protein